MAPFLCDGVYKIRNAQFTDFVADLIDGIPYGPISAYTEHKYNRNDKWRLVNQGDSGNVVTLESVSVPGSFADAQEFPGASLAGAADQTQWILLKEDRGRYAIQTLDGNYVWELPQGRDYVNIVLVPHTGQDDTRWYFERIGDCVN